MRIKLNLANKINQALNFNKMKMNILQKIDILFDKIINITSQDSKSL